MKQRYIIPVALLALLPAARAATVINLTGITPNAPLGLGGESLEGVVSTIGGTLSATTAGIPINVASSTNTGTYGITVSNLNLSSAFAGATNVTVTFNLTLVASAGDGLVINGGANKTWVVDDSGKANATNPHDLSRLNTGETITFSVSSVSFTDLSGSITGVSFAEFTGATFGGTGGTFVNATGVATGFGPYTGTDTSTRLDTIALNLNVVPEPSAALLGGIGLLALLRRRR